MNFENRIIQLQEMIDQSERIVFFGGAGVSTESGIPDFRSKNGLYNTKDEEFTEHNTEYYLSKDCLYNKTSLFFKFYKAKMDVRNYNPNITHIKLAQLEKNGKMLGVVTQNIDCLHQKAGSEKVFEIHGTTAINYCHRCNKKYGPNYIFEYDGKIPYCEDCGNRGIVRPDVTLYGERLPGEAFNSALEAITHADMLIVAGTSLKVFPAANLVSNFFGRYLIIINNEPTDYDSFADVVFRENIGSVFSVLNI